MKILLWFEAVIRRPKLSDVYMGNFYRNPSVKLRELLDEERIQLVEGQSHRQRLGKSVFAGDDFMKELG